MGCQTYGVYGIDLAALCIKHPALSFAHRWTAVAHGFVHGCSDVTPDQQHCGRTQQHARVAAEHSEPNPGAQ